MAGVFLGVAAPVRTPLGIVDGVITAQAWLVWLTQGSAPQAMVLVDTRANRANYAPARYLAGTLFIASDTGVVYRNTGTAWVYLSGQMEAPLASLPTLTADDAGFLYYENAVYFHQIRWTGTAWERGPNDRDSADTFYDKGALPAEGGWHALDGSTVTYFVYTDPANPASRVLPATGIYRKPANAYSPATVPAAAVTLAINPITPAGTVAAPTFTGTPATLTNAGLGTLGGGSSVLTSVNGSNTTYAPAGANSAPAFTGAAVTPTGTGSIAGDPIDHFSAVGCYRR